jgi:predicted acylesterase/phospholipase RssA
MISQQPENISELSFENIVFAGGGNRCFWQAGFWEVAAPALALAPKRVAACSAGSAVACAIFAGRSEAAMSVAKKTMTHNPKNQYWGNLFRQGKVFPHESLYRQMVVEIMDQAALAQLAKGPDILVEVARLPRWLGPKSATLVGLSLYQLEKKLRQPVHPTFGRKIGFSAEFINARQCNNAEELANIILASSCTPPFTSVQYPGARAALDGGMVDNVPVEGISSWEQAYNDSQKTLVLLTRPYPRLPSHPHRLYMQPSSPVAAKSWDYTNPLLLQQTFDQGRRDAEQFLAMHA